MALRSSLPEFPKEKKHVWFILLVSFESYVKKKKKRSINVYKIDLDKTQVNQEQAS